MEEEAVTANMRKTKKLFIFLNEALVFAPIYLKVESLLIRNSFLRSMSQRFAQI